MKSLLSKSSPPAHSLLPADAEPAKSHLADYLITALPTRHFRSATLVMAMLGGFLIWASLAPLEEYAIAEGEVVPQEQIQTIQHLEGGIIEKIHVFEGDRVKADQPLVQLNLSSFQANRQELQIKLEGLLLKKARLEAEAAGQETLTFDKAFADYNPSLIRTEMQTFEGRQQKLQSNLRLLKEQVQQKQLDKQQLVTERNSIAGNLGVLRQKLGISTQLIRDKLTSKLDHLQLQNEVKELEGRLSVINVAIPRADAALAEAQERYQNEKLTFQNEAQSERSEVEVTIAQIRENLSSATDKVQRTTIKSPIDGIVKSLKTHTIGGVVKPGDAVMEIVPLSNNLIIEAKLKPQDIGFVHKGQKALVKFLTYDYPRYGGLEGLVESVSADSHTDSLTGASYFRVRVRTDRNFLQVGESQFPIAPGMQATVDIRTGEKTVMEYLLKPVVKVKGEAFRER
jgi:adhesin transport system membrane fusion protein